MKVVGWAQTPNSLFTLPVLSRRTRTWEGFFPKNLIMFSRLSLVSIRRTERSSVGYNVVSFSKEGPSFLQFGHHVAQKLMRSTLPRNPRTSTVFPVRSSREKSGQVWGWEYPWTAAADFASGKGVTAQQTIKMETIRQNLRMIIQLLRIFRPFP